MADDKKKGGGNLASQIKRLEADMPQDKIDRAKKLATSEPAIVRLAFKYIDKPKAMGLVDGLTKTQSKFYDQMKAINPQAAEEWKKNATKSTSK